MSTVSGGSYRDRNTVEVETQTFTATDNGDGTWSSTAATAYGADGWILTE